MLNSNENKIGFYLIAFMLVFAPLLRAGNRPLALLILELAAILLAAYALWRPDYKRQLNTPVLAILGVLIAYPLLQLLPLPQGLWTSLPGRDYYAQAASWTNSELSTDGWRAGSLIPFRTELAWLALLPPVMVFVVSAGLSSRQLQTLVMVFLGVAVFQSILGLIQSGAGPYSLFRLGNTQMLDSAVGTYANRNHLAGMLEMALPVGLALMTATLGSGRSHRRRSRQRTLRQRLAQLTSEHVNRALIYGIVSIAILLGLIFTRSRAGLLFAMLGIFLCTLAFSRRLGGSNIYGWIGTFSAVGLGLAITIGLAPILSRFAQEDFLGDARWSIFSSTLSAAGEFFPFGSGSGTFPEVYRRFQSTEVSDYVNRAHNDYLEWFMETGLIVPILLVVMLVIYLRQWLKIWQRGTWPMFRFIQAGAGIALFLMILHGFVDFNLHIPANAIYFTFLMAIFLHKPTPSSRHRRRIEKKGGEIIPVPQEYFKTPD